SVLVSSEDKIKAQENAAAFDIRAGNGRHASLTNERILVVESEAGAAGDEWTVPIAKGQGVDVTQIAGVGRQCLARHANQLVPIDEDELWVPRIVRLDHPAIPGRPLCASGQVKVRGRAGAQEGALRRVRVHGHEI